MSAPSKKTEKQIYYDIRIIIDRCIKALKHIDDNPDSIESEYAKNGLASQLTDYAYPLQENR